MTQSDTLVPDSPAPDAVPAPDAAPAAPGPAIRTIGLTKRYGNLFAVRDVNLTVPTGAVFGLIGPNGAGKTTTMAIIASLLRPTAGRVVVAGFDPAEHPRDVRRHLGFMPDVLGVYDNLRVQEYLEFFAAAYKIPKTTWPGLIDGLLELVDLTGKRQSAVNSLSRGMKQRLSLARALVHDPDVLVLDEPASGLDPRARIDLRNLLLELQSMGKTVVISSHILPELQEVCTDVAIMEAGRLLAAGPPRTILDQLGTARTVRVRLAGGEERTYTVADDAEQAALLKRLVDEDEPVVEFAQTGGGLEDLFLAITKGAVQ
jgi:ABC-2 type transport system ATP-binding protein